MAQIPQDNKIESTLAFVNDGYRYISKRCNELQSDIFQTRLMFQKTICMKGEEAAKTFYDTELFKREGVTPNLVKVTLFGEGGVQGLDDADHVHRKQMFMSLMGKEGIRNLSQLAVKHWEAYADKWEEMDNITLFPEVQEILCRSVCEWTGVPLPEDQVTSRTEDIAAMIDGAGSIGKRHWEGRAARNRTEEWIKNLILKVRKGELNVASQTALHDFSLHRDLEGNLLDEQIAAVELINVLRPTVAVSRFIIFAALALHQNPEYRKKIHDDEEMLTNFVQEVRRFYPFFPLVAAEVRKDFDWNGYHFPRGRRVLLDLYGTNNDPRIWKNPGKFFPERFNNREEGDFDLIPQGGGSYHKNHRCAGEWITLALMKIAVKFLTDSIEYDVPNQDLTIDFARMPAIPESRFIIQNVR